MYIFNFGTSSFLLLVLTPNFSPHFEFDDKYINRCLLLKYQLIFFTCLFIFDLPKGLSNTFKTWKISGSVPKEGI